jgi:hypothetical protein
MRQQTTAMELLHNVMDVDNIAGAESLDDHSLMFVPT